MSSSQKLKSLENHKQRIESQIAGLEKLSNQCNQDIIAETNSARRTQLNLQIDNYSIELKELYNRLDKIEKNIEKLKLGDESLPPSDHLDNPKNQQVLKFDECLCDIDFERALETFQQALDIENIQSQFNQNGVFALFFLEESSSRRGDLCLKILQNKLKPKTYYRNHFRHCRITYTFGNQETVTQQIGAFFEVKKEEVTLELVLQKISDSLQRNSVLFIEIDCNIDHATDVDPLIPWFINNFWKPLRNKVQEFTGKTKYSGIKVIAVISCNLKIKERFLTEGLSCYHNNNCSSFEWDKLVKIPLENWTIDEIQKWLSENINPSLTDDIIEKKAYRLFNESLNGVPRLVCDALQQQWQTLTN